MNRENKRKSFEKGYYKTHACNDSFTCKFCGALSHRKMPEATIATIARTAFAVSMWTSHPATVPAIAAV